MLSFNVRSGDDIWFGKDGSDLSAFQQIVIRETREDGGAVIVTPTEIIDVDPDGPAIPLGVHGVKVKVTQAQYDGHALLGMIAERDIVILKGRKYRQQIN